ncbi:MAG: small subunit ribosomal protein S16 [Verrucomicrobiales bacterium]
MAIFYLFSLPGQFRNPFLTHTMAVALRLKREGSKDRPFYRLVATDSRARRDGRFIESLGTYDPMSKAEPNHELDLGRVDYWISQGAQPSDTVASLVKKVRKTEKTAEKAEA